MIYESGHRTARVRLENRMRRSVPGGRGEMVLSAVRPWGAQPYLATINPGRRPDFFMVMSTPWVFDLSPRPMRSI